MKRHSLSIYSFVTGVLFFCLGIVFLMDQLEVIKHVDMGWVPAVVLLSLGIGGILQHARPLQSARRASERGDSERSDEVPT